MFEGRVAVDKWFRVFLADATDGYSAETAIAYGDVTVKYSYEGATSLSTYTPTTDDWKEAGEGSYWLRIGADEFTLAGKYGVSVAAAGCRTAHLDIEAVSVNAAVAVDRVKDMLFVRSVTSRHANGKPNVYSVGTAPNAFQVETTQDANGNTETEDLV